VLIAAASCCSRSWRRQSYLWLRSYMPIRPAGTRGPGPSSVEVKVVRDPDQIGERTAYIASGERPGSASSSTSRTRAGSRSLRYSYAGVFEREASIPMPVATFLVC
jgi:hypothetical protein